MSHEDPRPFTAEKPGAIRVRRRFGVPATQVFAAWLDPRHAGRWLFATATRPMTDVDIDARVAGAFRFADRHGDEPAAHTGEYIEIVPHRRLVFTLSGEHAPEKLTRVTVEITPRKAGCDLTLTHEHVPAERREETAGRWTGILYGLGVMLASMEP